MISRRGERVIPSVMPLRKRAPGAARSALEAGAHEGFALVALQTFGLGVLTAAAHLLLLRCELFVRSGSAASRQARLHEGTAFVARQVLRLGVGIAGLHLLLLSRGAVSRL